LRINTASDDAAGLSVAQNMQSTINAINMAVRNVGDATNLLTTADTSLSAIQDMLLRMKTLVVEGKNDSLSMAQKGNVNTELTELRNEMNNVATRTTFNGNNLLANTGTLSIGTGLVVGAAAGTNSAISNVTLTGAKAQLYTITRAGAAITLTGADGIAQTKTIVNGAIGVVREYDFNTLGIKFSVASSGATDATNADGVTSIAAAILALNGGASGQFTVTGAGTPTMDFQSGAATADFYRFSAMNVLTTGGNNSSADFTNIETSITDLTTQIGANNNTNVNTQFDTLSGRIDTAINKINTQRATLGSQMNRLSYANTNLLAQSTNMQTSRSAVIDTDFAKETASLTKGQIMQQAATAMLAQANQMPNVILSLLK